MTDNLKAAIANVLDEHGVNQASKGYAYIMDAVALLIEEAQKNN